MAKETNANIGFEKELWDAACVLWGHIPAADYRKVIIGLIFLRYVSSAFDKRYKELVEEGYGFEEDKEDEFEQRANMLKSRTNEDVVPLSARFEMDDDEEDSDFPPAFIKNRRI